MLYEWSQFDITDYNYKIYVTLETNCYRQIPKKTEIRIDDGKTIETYLKGMNNQNILPKNQKSSVSRTTKLIRFKSG